jgi:hypothetical protein
MREIEVSQALDVREKCQGDEVQGCEVSEIPLHVWQDEEAEGVRLWRRAEKDFLSFRSTRDDLIYPVFMQALGSMSDGMRRLSTRRRIDGLNRPLGARRWEGVYVRLYDAFV